MAGIDDDTWTDEEPEFTPDEEEPPKRIGAGKTADDLLPQALVESAIGMDGIARIIRTKAFCLVVQAPSAGWVAPLYRYLRIAGKHWNFHHSKSVARRSRSPQDDVSIDESMRALTSGGRCLGVSHQLALLPSGMVASADMTLVLPHPDARVVGAVIRAVTGRLPRKLADQTIAALDFDEIASAIRSGSTAKAYVDRLNAAAAKKVHHDRSVLSAPLLEDLHG